jgi:preprotein translocase subunit SecA
LRTWCDLLSRKDSSGEWNWEALAADFYSSVLICLSWLPELSRAQLTQAGSRRASLTQVRTRLAEREAEFTTPVMEHLMKVLLLQTIDSQWKDHLLSIDHLKEGIGLRGYGQKNPKQEYKREAYGLFMEMMGRIRQEVIQKLFRVQLAREDDVERMEAEQRRRRVVLNRVGGAEQAHKPVTREEDKVGRNDPCPCGSGQKYKKCCGK